MSKNLSDKDLQAIRNAMQPQMALILKLDAQTNRVIEYSVESLENVAAIVDGLKDNTSINDNGKGIDNL